MISILTFEGFEGQLVVQAMGEITRLSKERETQLTRHKEGLKLLRAAESREQEQHQQTEQKQRQSTAEAIVSRALTLPEFKVNGEADQAGFAPEALTFIRNASLGQLSPEDQQLLPVAAMRAMWHDRINVPRLQKEIASLKARVADLTSSQPGIADGSLKPSKEAESGLEPGQSAFEKAYARVMQGAGQS